MATVRREMEVCRHCGALESARVVHTRKDAFGNLVRYRVCSNCRRKMPALVLIRPRYQPTNQPTN